MWILSHVYIGSTMKYTDADICMDSHHGCDNWKPICLFYYIGNSNPMNSFADVIFQNVKDFW